MKDVTAYTELVPDWLKQRISFEYEIESLAWLMGKDIRQGKATDAEICVSIYLASLQAPLDHDAGQIYLYVATGLMEGRGCNVPEDIRVTELTQDQARKLNEWKYQLYRKRGKVETQISKAIKEVFGKSRKGQTPKTGTVQDVYVGDNVGGETAPPVAPPVLGSA
ncbi:MAG: hypothetical protein M0Q91_17590 [Methanoregula sp.]|nr:hypothetical protein [Methanoregula sp.]